jgi:hypothetical protein
MFEQTIKQSDLKNQAKNYQGLINLNHERKLIEFTNDLITHYADFKDNQYTLNFSDISEFDQDELVRLYIELTGRELTECVNGLDYSIDNEYTCALLNMLENNCKERRDYFASVVRDNVVKHYSQSLQGYINDACQNYFIKEMNDNGIFSTIDKENGEVVWGAF